MSLRDSGPVVSLIGRKTMPDEWVEEVGLYQNVHADLYKQDIDAAADDYEAQKRRTKIVNDNDNPWE